MIDSGLGETHINKFLAALGIPPVNHKLLKRREREFGSYVESLARESCSSAQLEEAKLSPLSLGPESQNAIGIDVSYDVGWQQRGSGKCYNSLSAHASMIGSKTGKVTDFATRIKKFRVCDYASKKGTAARKHDCQKNWNDTAKSVESDMAVSMLRRSSSHGKVQVKSITTDNDTTTSLKVTTEIRRDIKQIKGFNHTKKNLGSHLRHLQKIHKNLTPKVVEYFQNCFAIVAQKNKNDPIKIQAGLLNSVDHTFCEHGICGSSWCGFLQNREGYKHKSLPHGKDLKGPKLREELTSLFKVYASNAAMLAPFGSTQANESFNHVVASKSRHALFRLELKASRQRVDVTPEAREGDTYKSGVSLDANFDTTQIPELIPYPEIQRVHAAEYCFVSVDVETTSLSDTCDIVQLSAVTAERQFESYVFPSKPIASSASKITGLTLVGENCCVASQ